MALGLTTLEKEGKLGEAFELKAMATLLNKAADAILEIVPQIEFEKKILAEEVEKLQKELTEIKGKHDCGAKKIMEELPSVEENPILKAVKEMEK